MIGSDVKERSQSMASHPVGDAGRVLEAVTEIALATPEAGHIDRQANRLVAGDFRALDHAFGNFTIAMHIELEPFGAIGGCGDFLDGSAGHRAQRHDRAGCGRSSRCRELAFRMSESLDCHRREEDRHLDSLAKNVRREVNHRDIDQCPRLELNSFEGFTVAAEGDLVVGAAGNVVEERLRKLFPGEFLIVKDVQEWHVGIVAPARRAVICFW